MAYAAWNDVPAGEQNLLLDLAAQWEQSDGYAVPVSDNMGWLLSMADAGISDLLDFSQWMWNSSGTADQSKPWTGFGMTKDVYAATLNDYATRYEALTGQLIDVSQPGAGTQFFSYLSKGLTGSEFQQQFMMDKTMQATYGWLKYGLDYQSFQQEKLQMQTAFGAQWHPLSDTDAVAQLQYWHRSGGPDASARAAAPSPQKQAAVPGAAGQSVIR